MNDPDTLGFYTVMQLFRNKPDSASATLQFPPALTAQQRRIVRSLADKLNLDHCSLGYGQDRFVVVHRRQQQSSQSPAQPPPQQQHSQLDVRYRPIPTTRASTEHLTQPPPDSPRHNLRAVRSLTNLHHSGEEQQEAPPPLPPFNPAEFSSPFSRDVFQSHHGLGHRSSQESTISSTGRSMVFGSSSLQQHQPPTRQPHGPPQDTSRGFDSSRPSLSQIRPIGHGAKTPSHGSLSHGSGSRDSRGGSDSIMDLQLPHEY